MLISSLKNVVLGLGLFMSGIVSVSASAQQYGAIAYSVDDGVWGANSKAATSAAALDGATSYCRQSGGAQCSGRIWFTGCGALARGTNKAWSANHGGNVNEARSAAVNACTGYGGVNCQVIATYCAATGKVSDAPGTPVAPAPVTPAPVTPPSQSALQNAVVAFASARIGQQIGNGECWTLINEALRAAGARQPGSAGLGTYQYGTEVFSGFQAGDIMQFENVKFRYDDGTELYFPHHTAIIAKAEASGYGFWLLHQNINGNRTVNKSGIDLKAKAYGTIKVYRPLPR